MRTIPGALFDSSGGHHDQSGAAQQAVARQSRYREGSYRRRWRIARRRLRKQKLRKIGRTALIYAKVPTTVCGLEGADAEVEVGGLAPYLQ
jgi:hypothetical protein